MLELSLIIGTIFINVIALIVAWVKLKTSVYEISKDVKNHTDVSVQKLNGMLTYFIHSADRPMWIKSATMERGRPVFRMLEVNDNYGKVTGIARNDYLGKTDLEAGWDKDKAELFYKNDLEVWASGKSKTYIETIDGKPLRFRKMLLQTPDGTKKGIMGYAVECGDIASCPAIKKILERSPDLAEQTKELCAQYK